MDLCMCCLKYVLQCRHLYNWVHLAEFQLLICSSLHEHIHVEYGSLFFFLNAACFISFAWEFPEFWVESQRLFPATYLTEVVALKSRNLENCTPNLGELCWMLVNGTLFQFLLEECHIPLFVEDVFDVCWCCLMSIVFCWCLLIFWSLRQWYWYICLHWI